MQNSLTYFTRFYKLLILVPILCSNVFVNAQFKYDFKKNADNFFAKGDYYSAAIYYQKYLTEKGITATFDPYEVKKTAGKKAAVTKTKPDNYELIVYRLGLCYFTLKDYVNAEKWLATAQNFNNNLYADATLNYGICLRANGKYAEAQKQFETYLANNKLNPSNILLAKKELANCVFIQQQLAKKDAALFNIQKLQADVNTPGANYAPSGFGNTLAFTSTRKDSVQGIASNKTPFVNNLYEVENGSGIVQKSTIALPENTEQGVASYTADGNTIYFTRWVKKDGKNVAAIYASNKVNGNWQVPIKLNSNINQDGYSAKQPYISADGSYLIFASDMPGTVGKFDLWYAKVAANFTANAATNLGKTINTPEDEEAPFYHQQSGTLVFATNGRVGMGGFDLFESKGSVGLAWGEPQNLGAPINSVQDDIYFYNSNSSKLLKNAFFSSDRSSTCCLELFSANKIYKKYVSGVVADCATMQPIEGADISAVDNASGQTILISQLTNSQGKYLFERDNNQSITINATKTGYNIGSIKVSQVSEDVDTLFNVAICQNIMVVDTPKVTPPTPKKVYAHFAFNAYALNDKESIEVLDTLAALLKRETKLSLELDGYTDEIGSLEYNIKLSENRAKSCMEYLIKTGIDASRLSAKGFGKCCPIEPETTDGKDNPEARKVNRRVEFKITYL